MATQPKIMAFTRDLSRSIKNCELTHLDRQPIDYNEACRQHDEYENALRNIGVEVERLPSSEEFADGVFVEDTAVVFREGAVICRPGAVSRLGETAAIAKALSTHRRLVRIENGGTVDGGDVLVVGKDVYIGASGRSNAEGIKQFAAAVAPWGYRVLPVKLTGCLHLKTAVTSLGDGVLIANPEWIDLRDFIGYEILSISPKEPFAANTLTICDTVLVAETHKETQDMLAKRGYKVRAINNSELAKAEAGLTCCSLIFDLL